METLSTKIDSYKMLPGLGAHRGDSREYWRMRLIFWGILSSMLLAWHPFAGWGQTVPTSRDASALGAPDATQALTLNYSRIESGGFPTIVSYVTVNNDSGQTVGGLTKDNFEVYEDNVRELPIIVEELSDDSVGVNVALVIDRSTSMKGTPIDDAKAAASMFVQLMNSRDQGAIVSFASTPRTDQVFTQNTTSLTTAISTLQAQGGTAVFDALIHTANLIAPIEGRRAIILLTDGEDKDSRNTLQNALDAVLPLNLPVFTIGLHLNQGSAEEDVLIEIATQTHGRYYRSPSSSDLEAIYRAISALLHHQYRITYTTHNAVRDGTLRHVHIVAKTQNMTGAGDNTYRAPLDIVTVAATTQDVCAPGRDFRLQIEVPASSAFAFAEMHKLTFVLKYDATFLTIKKPLAANLVTGGLFGAPAENTVSFNANEGTGVITFTVTKNAGATLVSGRGILAEFTFQAPATLPDNIALSFEFVSLQAFNRDSVLIPTQTQDLTIMTYGYVTIAVTSKDECQPGKEFGVEVVIPPASKELPGMQALEFTLTYDARYLTVKAPSADNAVAGTLWGATGEYAGYVSVKAASGEIAFVLQRNVSAGMIKGRGNLARVRFVASQNLPDSTSLSFTLQNLVATDDTGWDIPIKIENLTVYSNGLIVWPGDTNHNGKVELTDVTVLGVYWAINGPGRLQEPDPLLWKAQLTQRYPVRNAAHADGDGSGRINERDIVPIGLNWGKTATNIVSQKAASMVADAPVGDLRLQIAPVYEQGVYRLILQYDSQKPVGLSGITFRVRYPVATMQITSALAGSAWPVQPLLISNTDKDGSMGVGLMLTAGSPTLNAGGELVELFVHAGSKPDLADFVFAEVALVTPDGKLHAIDLQKPEVGSATGVPEHFTLYPAYPNPFNPSTLLRYGLPEAGKIDLYVYTVAGQVVYKRRATHGQAGVYSWRWDGRDQSGRLLSSGVYFVKVIGELTRGIKFTDQEKITLMK